MQSLIARQQSLQRAHQASPQGARSPGGARGRLSQGSKIKMLRITQQNGHPEGCEHLGYQAAAYMGGGARGTFRDLPSMCYRWAPVPALLRQGPMARLVTTEVQHIPADQWTKSGYRFW